MQKRESISNGMIIIKSFIPIFAFLNGTNPGFFYYYSFLLILQQNLYNAIYKYYTIFLMKELPFLHESSILFKKAKTKDLFPLCL